jgi:C4-dicarboxylate-specific signal transduction histidine kinase
MVELEKVSTSVYILSEKPLIGGNLTIQSVGHVTDISMPVLNRLDVFILPLTAGLSDEVKKFLHLLRAKNPAAQILLIAPKSNSMTDLGVFLKQFSVFLILETFHLHEIESAALSALEKAQQLRQTQALETLVNEQNQKLRFLYKDLEDRIQKRQNYLLEAQSKAQAAHGRWKLLLDFSEALQGSESIGQIEAQLDLFIGQAFSLAATRLILGQQADSMRDQLKRQKETHWHQVNLFSGEEGISRGSVFFIAQPKAGVFKKEETDFFAKIAEVVALAIDRIVQFEKNLALQQHWQATFNAVSEPVVIINTQYDVLQGNSAFSSNALGGRKCYEALFQRESPCPDCRLGKTFRLEGKKLFEVHSHSLQDLSARDSMFVNQYHDITEQTQMEKKILEAARLAEIGTIGSSIAHELNNPLGGMLNYAQLIRMDLAKEHPLYQDVVAIEEGIKKSRDIVQNLLGFSRNPVLEAKAKVDLREMLHRAIKIIELQSKSLGVDLRETVPAEVVWVHGFAGYLTQALQNILHYSIQNILQETRQSGIKGMIEISLVQERGLAVFNIMDNGPAQENWTSLGLSMAHQIIKDHQGTLEFFEDKKPFHSVRVTLPLWSEKV